MQQIADIASWLCICLGGFFLITGAIGIIRMPDMYTRMHAASVIDTTGAGFLLLGMMIQSGFSLVTLKLLFILLIFFFISPVVSHALAQAALAADVEPQLTDDRRARGAAPSTDDKKPELP